MKYLWCILVLLFISSWNVNASQQDLKYVCTKYSKTNVRNGPNTDFLIKFVISKSSYPLKIKTKIGNWYLVNDYENNSGWVSSILTKTDCNVVVNSPKSKEIKLYKYLRGKIEVGVLQHGLLVSLKKCVNQECRIVANKISGWVDRDLLWGNV